MRRLILAAIGLIAFATVVYAIGLRIQVSFSGVRGYLDPKFVEGRFYKRPIHPGFITQRFPAPISRIAISKGRHSKGLPSAIEIEEK